MVVERSVMVVKWRCYKVRNIIDSLVLFLIILRRHAQESTRCDVTAAAVPPAPQCTWGRGLLHWILGNPGNISHKKYIDLITRFIAVSNSGSLSVRIPYFFSDSQAREKNIRRCEKVACHGPSPRGGGVLPYIRM